MSDEKLDLILKELSNLNDRVGNLEANTKEIKEEIKLLNKKSDTITKQVAENAENVNSIKENQVIIKEVIEQMAAIQNRQEETINLLARRSIDQEAELRRIK